MIVAGIIAKRRKFPVSEIPGLSEAIKIVWQALPPLLMVVVVIGGIVIGAFTATEGAAVAVLYSFVLSLIYRLASWREYIDVLKSSMVTSAVILFLIAASGVMSYVMTITGIPDAIADALLTFKNPIVILLIMNICLLIIGFFMDLTPAVLIFTPIFLPIAREVGMDPVQFGLMMIFNLGIGSMTPPGGLGSVRRLQHWRCEHRKGGKTADAVLHHADRRVVDDHLYPGAHDRPAASSGADVRAEP